MKRLIISAVCAAALAATFTAASAANNSVSGYVSLTEGEQIAGFDISMCI